jgi:hypothetical protein
VLLWAAGAFAADQPSWTGSHIQMQELGEGDALPLQHLSASELSLIRKNTSGERAYRCKEADFQSLRVRRLELGAHGGKFLAVAGGSACLRGGNVPNYYFLITEVTASKRTAQLSD